MPVITIINILSAFFSDRSIWVLALVLGILLLFLVIYLIYNFCLKSYLIKRCNQEEIWLPIVDDTGNVIGRVAQSVSIENPGKFQHPLIRIVVWSKEKMYLKPRPSESLFDIGKFDNPFEIVLKYGKSIEETLEEVHRNYLPYAAKPHFMLKYSYENSKGKWQVFLYYVSIFDESRLKSLNFSEGKLWPIRQVKDNIGKTYFSDIFENELEFSSVFFDDED